MTYIPRTYVRSYNAKDWNAKTSNDEGKIKKYHVQENPKAFPLRLEQEAFDLVKLLEKIKFVMLPGREGVHAIDTDGCIHLEGNDPIVFDKNDLNHNIVTVFDIGLVYIAQRLMLGFDSLVKTYKENARLSEYLLNNPEIDDAEIDEDTGEILPIIKEGCGEVARTYIIESLPHLEERIKAIVKFLTAARFLVRTLPPFESRAIDQLLPPLRPSRTVEHHRCCLLRIVGAGAGQSSRDGKGRKMQMGRNGFAAPRLRAIPSPDRRHAKRLEYGGANLHHLDTSNGRSDSGGHVSVRRGAAPSAWQRRKRHWGGRASAISLSSRALFLSSLSWHQRQLVALFDSVSDRFKASCSQCAGETSRCSYAAVTFGSSAAECLVSGSGWLQWRLAQRARNREAALSRCRMLCPTEMNAADRGGGRAIRRQIGGWRALVHRGR
jgi:hypothetical protein